MSESFNPILNSPYDEPNKYYFTFAVETALLCSAGSSGNQRWLPAVNSIREKYSEIQDKWDFVEITDIKTILKPTQ